MEYNTGIVPLSVLVAQLTPLRTRLR